MKPHHLIHTLALTGCMKKAPNPYFNGNELPIFEENLVEEGLMLTDGDIGYLEELVLDGRNNQHSITITTTLNDNITRQQYVGTDLVNKIIIYTDKDHTSGNEKLYIDLEGNGTISHYTEREVQPIGHDYVDEIIDTYDEQKFNHRFHEDHFVRWHLVLSDNFESMDIPAAMKVQDYQHGKISKPNEETYSAGVRFFEKQREFTEGLNQYIIYVEEELSN